ncbi:MAG: CoA transferase [Deltaproteobacteria bacterium]|jgi:crotonobetainyl-CoA:carnitine CoA-transferase CaiB-like acyl-CoA transferase|nr:CoA transferase [Deltaproteobacteria bacterium]
MVEPADLPYLEGYRVLDFTQYLAGPACTRLMAELGAEVIKVELPPHGDPMRAAVPRKHQRSGAFIQQNRGKQSLCVDYRTDTGRAIIEKLVAHVDVVVENFSPGVMARRGLGYDDLRAVNPRVVMVSVSGFGQDGPLAGHQSFELIAQGYGGMMHMTGEPDGPPTFAGLAVGDTNAGVHAFAAIGYALLRRERTGLGMHVDVSMLDALFQMQEMAVQAPSLTGGEWQTTRYGGHYEPLSPAGRFKGPEGWIVLLCAHNQIGNLFEAMGRPELASDERFRNNNERIRHRADLTALIEDWMATFATDAEVLANLEEHRVPSGPVLSPAEAIEHPAFVERGTVRWIEDRRAGPLAIPGFPIRFSDAPPEGDLQAPFLGEHNRSILVDLLGHDESGLEALLEAGVLAAKDR